MAYSALIRRLAFVLCALTLFAFSFAHAESVQWNTNEIPTLFYYYGSNPEYGPDSAFAFITNTNVSVEYSAQAVNADTGASVCGTTIPRGTHVRFRFAPHTPQDIVWFGTGFDHGSPYGDWIANAASPSGPWCSDNNYVNTYGIGNESHVPLSIDPPDQDISGTGRFTCGTPDSDGSVTCTASSVGSTNPSFNFDRTSGHFYFAIKWAPYWGSPCTHQSEAPGLACPGPYDYPYGLMHANNCTPQNNAYTLSVPSQSISCSIIIESPEGEGPSKPTVSASGAAACTVGTPYSLTISATDPDNDDVKYGVDWDANGTIDQFVPSTGYVPSGTSQTVSRTYATEGSKTVKVMAIDDNGLTSSWSTLTFSCTDEGAQGQGGGENLGGGDEGGSGGGGGGATPNLTIRAIPSLVRTGETTNLHWSASNVTACTVQGSNGDSFTGTISQEPAGNETSAITGQTTYTLSCTDEDGNSLTQSTTVNVLPVWSEF